jgi:hypothetical protein
VQGEPLNTVFHYRTEAAAPSPAPATPTPPAAPARPADKIAALTLAGQQVSKVFRAGRHWKFSVLNTTTGQWEESPAIGSQDEAERLRDAAVRRRYEELCQA